MSEDTPCAATNMDTSERSILRKYGVTEKDVEEELERQVQRRLFSGGFSLVTGLPENLKQKRAQECAKALAEQKAKKQGSIKWMKMLDPMNGDYKFVRVKVDSGASKNFMTEGMVTDHHLQKMALEAPQRFDMPIGGFICSYTVEVTLFGQDDQKADVEFFVLPAQVENTNIDAPLLSEEWTSHSICKLFDSKDVGDLAYVGQKTPKTDEKRAAQALRAQATAQRSQLIRAKEARKQQESLQKAKDANVEVQSTSKPAKQTKQ